jgi:hypothetical protein
MEKDTQGKKTKHPRYSHRTTSTMLQLAVDHAGSYAKHFRPADPIAHAHAATHFAPPNIYCGSAPSSINNALTTQSTLMGTPFHILPYTTHTPTNSYLSSKTAVPCNALLILDPQWK